MVAAVKSPPATDGRRNLIITAISKPFAEWCQERGYPLNLVLIQAWQSEFRASRPKQDHYRAYSAEQLAKAEAALLARLERIRAAKGA